MRWDLGHLSKRWYIVILIVAVKSFGGIAEVAHSEDIITGLHATKCGYSVTYIPVILSMGICPNDLRSFFNQQYRWASGSAFLVKQKIFWEKDCLNLWQRICYMTGLIFYISSALSIFLTPVPLLLVIFMNPRYIHWFNLIYAIPSILIIPIFWRFCRSKNSSGLKYPKL